ncbi:hypothetical protein [Microbispora sp. NBC_01389]|uniref:hypothetical protein n=1 Tax=Microbispora sp. NBC_01389 TaxID=2903584 RepID=UPI00325152FF
MTTAFGDFLREASEQMNTAVYCAERSVSGVAAIATIDPERRMTTVLLRYLDDLAPERAPAPMAAVPSLGPDEPSARPA